MFFSNSCVEKGAFSHIYYYFLQLVTTPDEAAELGRLLPAVSQALQKVVGCQKTYVVQFADHPEHPHVHFYVIPITADLPAGKRGPGVFGYLGVPEEERISEMTMNEIAARVRDFLR